jgi:hypothetical protein
MTTISFLSVMQWAIETMRNQRSVVVTVLETSGMMYHKFDLDGQNFVLSRLPIGGDNYDCGRVKVLRHFPDAFLLSCRNGNGTLSVFDKRTNQMLQTKLRVQEDIAYT